MGFLSRAIEVEAYMSLRELDPRLAERRVIQQAKACRGHCESGVCATIVAVLHFVPDRPSLRVAKQAAYAGKPALMQRGSSGGDWERAPTNEVLIAYSPLPSLARYTASLHLHVI